MHFKDPSDYDSNHDWQSILNIWEEFNQITPVSNTGSVKRQVAAYLKPRQPGKPLSKTELRQLLSKARKLKKSTKKGERARGIELEKQIRTVFNIQK
jgi:hypothetical protein